MLEYVNKYQLPILGFPMPKLEENIPLHTNSRVKYYLLIRREALYHFSKFPSLGYGSDGTASHLLGGAYGIGLNSRTDEEDIYIVVTAQSLYTFHWKRSDAAYQLLRVGEEIGIEKGNFLWS